MKPWRAEPGFIVASKGTLRRRGPISDRDTPRGGVITPSLLPRSIAAAPDAAGGQVPWPMLASLIAVGVGTFALVGYGLSPPAAALPRRPKAAKGNQPL